MSQLETATALQIAIQGNGLSFTHVISEGESVLVGSDAHCRIRINDPSVPERQCLLQFMQGDVFIHDWSPEHPTTVNGQPSDACHAVSSADRIAFGDFVLQLGTTNIPTASDDESSSPDENPTTETTASPRPSQPVMEPPVASTSASTPAAAEPDALEALQAAIAQERPSAPSPTITAPPPLATFEQEPAPVEEPPKQEQAPVVVDDGWDTLAMEDQVFNIPVDTSVQASTIELLTLEVESLQAELSDKNGRITELEQNGGGGEALLDEHSEIERRIDQLLAELELGDDRVSAVEESLRLSEETRHAELEEKDNWNNGSATSRSGLRRENLKRLRSATSCGDN